MVGGDRRSLQHSQYGTELMAGRNGKASIWEFSGRRGRGVERKKKDPFRSLRRGQGGFPGRIVPARS